MNMHLEQLRGFAEVADTSHFTRAAERLHLTQPSLSRQIAALETALGVELFHRLRGNVTLTAAGERLLPIAKRMLADAQTAEAMMAELAGLEGGRVRIGATPTLCTSLLVEVIAEYRRRHPAVAVEVLERGSKTLIDALIGGEVDLALIVTSVAPGGERAVLEREPILSEQLVVAAAADARWPASLGHPVTMEALAATPQIMFPANYDLRAALDREFRERALAPTIAVEGVEMDAALRFAERGVGVVVVPAMVAVDRPTLRVAPLADPGLARTVSIAKRSDMTATHAALAMGALVRETADRLATADTRFSRLLERVANTA